MEMWMDIPGYEGIYQASNLGAIRTSEGKTTYTERHGVRRWKQRILKQKITPSGKGRRDARVSLWKDGKERTMLVARLVGMAWCEGYAEGLTINHKDGNPMNNAAENLEWISREDNIRHAFRTGLCSSFEKKTTLVSESDGKEHTFASMAEANRYLGRTHGYVYGCVQKGRMASSVDGERYRIA